MSVQEADAGREQLERIIELRPSILVFLPNTNELQRFVLSGAFDELDAHHDIHYVVSSSDLPKMREAAPEKLTEARTIVLDIAPERYAAWSELFQAACFQYADISPSFAIRASFGLSSPRARLLKRVPPAAWSAANRGASMLSATRLLPKHLRSRLKHVAAVFDEAVKNTKGFAYLNKNAYSDLVRKTLSSLRPLPEITEIFDRVRPLYVVIPSSLLDLYCNDVLWSCEAEGVPCLVLQSGWDNLSSKGIIHHKPMVLGCWGKQSVQHAVSIQQMPASSLHVLGAPHYEFLKPASAAEISEFRQSLGVRDDERLILFGGSFRQFDETDALRRLEQLVESGRFGPTKILFRPHPWRADRQDEDDFFQQEWKHVVFDPDMQDRYMRARAQPGYLKRAVPMYDMAYLARVLSAVDAVISPMSTLLLEALIMRRPTMAIAFGDGKHSHNPSVTARMTHFKDAKKSGALVWCDDSNRLEQDLAKLLAPNWFETIQENQQRLLARVAASGPGTYASRLEELSRTVLEPRARKMRAQRTSRRRVSISNAYGANLIARDYAGVPIDEPLVPGYWMHGWIPGYHNVDSALIALHKKPGQDGRYDYDGQIREEKQSVPQWVSREDQARFLRDNGYRHVRAIGLPIVYIPDQKVPRIRNSLLVMPPHSHRNHGPADPLAEQYAEQIYELRKDFEHIRVCLHEDDLAKQQWVESFRRRGIEVFVSADQADPYTLVRLKRILSAFECVTTNGYGSHIAYAAYCGARISIFGPFAEFPRDRILRTHAVKMFPELSEQAYWLCTKPALKQHFPFLFGNPKDAELRQEWGAEQVGEPNRLSPQELAALFDWNATDGSKTAAAAERSLAASAR